MFFHDVSSWMKVEFTVEFVSTSIVGVLESSTIAAFNHINII